MKSSDLRENIHQTMLTFYIWLDTLIKLIIERM